MNSSNLLRNTRTIWLTTYAFVCGFNVGRGNWLGVGMFLAGSAALIIFTNKAIAAVSADREKMPGSHPDQCPICSGDFTGTVSSARVFGVISCPARGVVVMTRQMARDRFTGTPPESAAARRN